MEAVEAQGEWWLPERPDRKVPGVLVVDESGRAELRLLGALRDMSEGGDSKTENGTTTVTYSEASIERSGSYPRIHGDADGGAFTLVDCFQTQASGMIFGGRQSERILVNQGFRGILFESDELIQFDKIYVQMVSLAYWVERSGLKESVEFEKNEDGISKRTATNVRLEPVPSETIAGPASSTVTLGQVYGISGDRTVERKLTQDFYFSVSYGQVIDLRDLLDQVSDLQDIVSIGTGRTAAYTSVQLRHPDIVQKIGDVDYEPPIDFFAHWSVRNDDPVGTLSRHDMYFTLADMGGLQALQRWLDVAVLYRSQLGRVMATRYSRSMATIDRVSNCVAALEAYDREKHNDNINLIDRLRRCAQLAGDPFAVLVGDIEKWVKDAKDSRHDIAHHKSGIDAPASPYHLLGESAYWLFVLCLLRDCVADQTAFDRIPEHAGYRWLARRMAELLPP